jgi:hypothetical protein
MKKFTLFLLGVAVFVAVVFVAAPVLAGAAIGSTLLFRGVQLVATTAGIPAWAAVLIFIALIPSALWWFFQTANPKICRRLVIILIGIAVVYALITTALTNQHLVDAAHGATASIQKLLPVKAADPAQPWFSPAGTPRLFFVHPTTNVWAFYRAHPGAHDPATGAELQPVTPLIRELWQAEQMREREAEMAKENEAAAIKAATEKAATDMKEQQAAAEREKAEEQRKTDESARGAAAQKIELEKMKRQVADAQQKIEEQRQKLEIVAAVKVEQTRDNQKAVASEDDRAARNQQIVVANTQRGYWIIDGRGQEFGPVSIAQLQQWIVEGRAGANTPVYAEGWQGWKLLGSILPCPVPVVFYYRQYYRQPSYFIRIWH